MKTMSCGNGLFVIALLLMWLSGCANSTEIVQDSGAPAEKIRVILTFRQAPPSNDERLSHALAEACHCSPLFVRRFLDTALIYQVALPQAQTFASFEKALLEKARALGLQSVEQDVLMRHQ